MRLPLATILLYGMGLGCAGAAPFCLVIPSGGKQCVYYDGASCARDANHTTGGACEANTDEVRMQSVTGGGYCVVTGQGASVCGYSDPNSCAREALRQRGACVRPPTAAAGQLPQYYAPNLSR